MNRRRFVKLLGIAPALPEAITLPVVTTKTASSVLRPVFPGPRAIKLGLRDYVPGTFLVAGAQARALKNFDLQWERLQIACDQNVAVEQTRSIQAGILPEANQK